MEFEGLQRNRKIPSLTPLIDIVFLLLVFFMLTAHFVKDEALDISLPEADSSTAIEDEGALEIVLDNQGHILIDKKHVAANELEKVIQQQLHNRRNKQIILRGDKIAQLGLTVSVMDAARKAGATSLDIVTQKP
ncbi:MAG: biopolymer transporter ExbD [Gammaproteobacteria bacterium]|nr:biopolymer transporter ExbD [Gammaproteobacteria bacterium]MCW8987532.1 biopolymer transporter ExbD [Gammaproteobacteria bacterium]MCW9029988.1 biopolymer transporter ExbD [Gammaproteobacteria bacterium]